MNDLSIQSSMTHRESFRVFGVGGGGGRFASRIQQSAIPGIAIAALDTDSTGLQSTGLTHVVQIGPRRTRGLGTGGDPDIGVLAAEESLPVLADLCAGAQVVLVLAALGGGVGSGVAPILARTAREAGALAVALVAMPFECEGVRRQRQARRGLAELQQEADAVICLDLQRVASLVPEQATLVECLSTAADLALEGVRGIWQLSGQPGLIKADLADLCQLLRGRHAESVIATAETVGPDRVKQALDQVVLSPLLGNGSLLRELQSALVSLTAGVDLTLAEVQRISEVLRRECGGAELLVGAAVDPALKDRLRLTFVGVLGSARDRGESYGLEATAPSPQTETGRSVQDENRMEADMFSPRSSGRKGRSRFVPPPPELSQAERENFLARHPGPGAGRRSRGRPQQALLPLEVVSRGRFERSEPTIHHGEDLDVPTFVRRGLILN